MVEFSNLKIIVNISLRKLTIQPESLRFLINNIRSKSFIKVLILNKFSLIFKQRRNRFERPQLNSLQIILRLLQNCRILSYFLRGLIYY